MAKGSGGGGTNDRNIYGTAGNDTLGTRDRSITFGLQGDDTITGLATGDVIVGGDGNDTVRAGDGGDFVMGGLGSDFLDGGAGRDTLSYENINFGVLNAGVGASAGVTVNLNLTTAQNTGGAGIDTIFGFENLNGSQFNDVLTGLSTLTSQILGGGGNDRITGGSAGDLLSGDAGNDTVDGGGGGDFLWGGAGNDTVRGGAGDDYITEDGNGSDVIDGGLGRDSLSYDNTASGVRVDLSVLTAQNTGGGGIDTITNVESIVGTRFNDVLTGNALANTISGGDGADVLSGMGGNDVIDGGGLGGDKLFGGDGNDTLSGAYDIVADGGAGADVISGTGTLIGGAGNDKITGGAGSFVGIDFVAKGSAITGGAGADTFVFDPAYSSYADIGISKITDFSHLEGDRIDFHTSSFRSTATPLEFIGDAEFSSFVGHDQVRVVQSGINQWEVQTDVNGDRFADTVIQVASSTALVAGDFIL